MKIKFISLLAILLVALVPISFVSASSIDDVIPGLKEYLGDNYKEQIIKNTKSAQNIEEIESMLKPNTFFSTNDLNINYPDYIGGLYIDAQDNSTVIQIVKKNIPSDKLKEEYGLYNSIISVDENAKIEYVDYSYNEINEAIQILDEYYSENYETGYIDGYYDDITNNRVVVELKEYSEENIDNIKKYVIDSPLIHFTESKNTTEYLTTYLPGAGILPLGCSVGFRAKYNNVLGFVTAGHCVTGVGQDVPLYGTVKKYRESGNIDASWIQNEYTVSIGNTLRYIPSINYAYPINNTPVSSFSVGQLYGKSGVASQYTYGKITSTSVAMNGLTGLVNTDVYATNGDSGGIVFKISGSGNAPTDYQTAGIVHGGPKGGGNMAFVKASSIVSAFNLTTY